MRTRKEKEGQSIPKGNRKWSQMMTRKTMNDSADVNPQFVTFFSRSNYNCRIRVNEALLVTSRSLHSHDSLEENRTSCVIKLNVKTLCQYYYTDSRYY